MVLDASADATISISAESGSGLIMEMSAGEVLGESWTVVVPDTPSWSTLQ
jgi:hypothetical protein